jgi:hypothetical protein
VTTSHPRTDASPERRAATAPTIATVREDAITAILGTLLVGGVLTDAWAHTNILDTIEGFFTPWHGLLYTGFAGTAGWTFWLAYKRRAGAARWWRDAWPAGYAVGALGAVLFLVGGIGDMFWHTIFGIEVGLDAALSPSHLLIDFASVLLLTSPLRSWWAANEGGPRAVTGVLSMGLGTTMATVLLLNISALASTAPIHPYEPGLTNAAHLAAVRGMASYLVTTVLLVVPLLLVHRRRSAWGAATVPVAMVSTFVVVTYGAPRIQLVAAVAAVVGAAATDWALIRLDAIRGPNAPLRLPLAGAVFAILVWSAHLVGLQLAAGIAWPPELWAGTVVLSTLLAALLGGLAANPAAARPATDRWVPTAASPASTEATVGS